MENLIKTLKNEMKEDYGDRDIKSIHFSQLWGSTALGYGGIGCDAMTTAETIIIFIRNGPARVYFGREQLAYEIDMPNRLFWNDVKNHNMKECGMEKAYEEKNF